MQDHFPGAPLARRSCRALLLALALAAGDGLARPAAPPPPPAPIQHYPALAQRLQGQHPALLVNPCLLRSEVRDNFVVKNPSQDLGNQVGATLLDALNAHGLPAGPVMVPLICAQGEGPRHGRAADSFKGRRGAVDLPITTDPAIDPALALAFETLYTAVGRAAEPDPLFPAAAPPESRFRLAPDDQARLRAAVGGRYVWVLNMAAADVSRLHGFSQRVLGRIAPQLANGDPGRAVSAYALGLVDLDTAAVLWKREAGHETAPATPGRYDAAWADQLLAPLGPPPSPPADGSPGG